MNKLNALRDSGGPVVMIRYAYDMLDKAREAHTSKPTKATALRLENAELDFKYCIILEKFDPIPPLNIVEIG